jgi:hypothetical protein
MAAKSNEQSARSGGQGNKCEEGAERTYTKKDDQKDRQREKYLLCISDRLVTVVGN